MRTFVVDRVNIDEDLRLPARVVRALHQEPLLEAAHLHVALNLENRLHHLVLDDKRVRL